MTASVTVLGTMPLLDRVRVAQAVGGELTFGGEALDELRKLILAGDETRLGYLELRREVEDLQAETNHRALSVADEGRAAFEREARVTRAWMVAAYLVAALSLALRSGGFLP